MSLGTRSSLLRLLGWGQGSRTSSSFCLLPATLFHSAQPPSTWLCCHCRPPQPPKPAHGLRLGHE